MGKRNRWRGWAVGLVVLGLVAPAARVDALSAPPRQELILRKLGRGLANIVTCPAELIRVPLLVGRTDGSVASLSVGVVKGIWRTVLRGGAGVIETATFFVGIPNADFRPLITPEFVYAHGSFSE